MEKSGEGRAARLGERQGGHHFRRNFNCALCRTVVPIRSEQASRASTVRAVFAGGSAGPIASWKSAFIARRQIINPSW